MRRRFTVALTTAALTLAGLVGVSVAQRGATVAAAPAPIRAAWSYNWYPSAEHWATQYHPTLGKYDSGDRAIMAKHIEMGKYAGLDAFISSWWGRDSSTGRLLPMELEEAGTQGFHVTPYYELESNSPAPTAAVLQSDFDYLYGLSADPAWLRVDGKPVLFIYNTGAEGSCAGVQRVLAASAGRFYLNAKVFGGYRTCPAQPASWHQYGPAVGYDGQTPYAATVSPGFWKFNEASPRLVRDPVRFRSDLQRQVASGAQWQLTTTLNEWGEGSSVEPATEWQSASGMGDYLDIMRDVYSGAPPTSSSTTTPTSTTTSSTPTSTSTTTTSTSTPTTTTSSSSSTTTTTSTSSSSTSTTATTPPGGSVTIAMAGDIACDPASAFGTNSCAHNQTAALLESLNPDAVLTLGDNQYNSGALSAYQNSHGYNGTWGRLKAKTYPTPGNHEWGTSNAQGYRDYFRTGGPAAVRTDRTWYSFSLGAWHLIALDSDCSRIGGCTAGRPEYEFLKADLLANDGKPTLVYFHHPRWANGDGDHGDNLYLKPIFDLLVSDLDVQAQFNGHVHRYLRYAPMGVTGPDPNGIRVIAVGTGGKDHSGCATTNKPGLELQNCNSFGVMKVVLNANGSWGWQFMKATGSFTDSGSQARR